ncbi:MAG TPA: TonB-dependent receptor [Phnomibacter sp.]|nr:TonB-dependent receptor [Phnomibacter sp.]
MSYKLFLVGAAISIASTAGAQQQDSTRTKELEQVTITANKFLQKQNQTGKVVTVISKEQIEKSQGKTLGQVLNEQAGVTINGALNNLGSNQGVYTRGANIGRTLILIDGVPAYDPSFINSETDLNLFSINGIERIEIARGAQSTMYGSDAVAGVINIITTKASVQKPFNASATAAYGKFNTFRGNLQVFGKTEKLEYSARYGKLKSDGFSSATDKTGNQNFDNDGYNSDATSASLTWKATQKLQVKTYAQYTHNKTELDAGSFADEKDYTNTSKNLLAGTSLQYTSKRVVFTGNYMFSQNNRSYLNDSIDKPGFAKYVTDDYEAKAHFAELYANISIAKGLNALVGLDYRRSNMNSQYYSLSAYGPFESSFKDTSLWQGSIYGSLVYTTGRLNIEAGGRYNKHERYGNNATFTFNPSFAISDHYRLFGSVASGFKAPSLYQLYSGYGNKDLQPEKSINYELGIQQSCGKISNRLLYFYRDITDGIDFDNINYSYFNISKQKVQGLELESSYNPTNSVSIKLNYTFLHPTENVQSRMTFKDTTYDYLLRRPTHQLNATVGWNITEAFYASLNGKYVSDRYDAAGYMVPDAKMNAYGLLGAYFEYKLPNNHPKFFLDLQNITNKHFVDTYGYNTIPFNIQCGVTLSL